MKSIRLFISVLALSLFTIPAFTQAHDHAKNTVAGDTVKTGQPIGLSGNTGYSAFPHLHFEVQGYDESGNYKQLATRFYTQKGVIYLRPGRFYRVLH